MEDWRENLSIISRLKIAGKQADALSARLFFERLFGGANFHPPGIPARSVVCIRKINAPPFKNYRPDFGTANLALDWETGIRREVEKSSRRAFRPIRETVPANAESVVFEDRAEMLACLAQDWLGGALAEHWWWRALFTRLFSTEMPFKIWLAAAEFAPSGLHILSKKAAADKFVGKLEPPQACELLREIIRIFGLAKLSAALLSEPLGKKALSSAQSIVKGAGKKRFRSDENLTSLTKSDALFRSLIPESEAAELSFEQQVLLETGLLLARSPRVARSPEFAERVKAVRTKTEYRKAFKETPPLAIFEQNKPLQMIVAALETNQRKARADGENQITQSRPAEQKDEPFDLQTTGEVESASEKPPFGLIT